MARPGRSRFVADEQQRRAVPGVQDRRRRAPQYPWTFKNPGSFSYGILYWTALWATMGVLYRANLPIVPGLSRRSWPQYLAAAIYPRGKDQFSTHSESRIRDGNHGHVWRTGVAGHVRELFSYLLRSLTELGYKSRQANFDGGFHLSSAWFKELADLLPGLFGGGRDFAH